MTTPPKYRLVFQATKGGEVPPIVRLRRLLKFALRACGLRCVEVAEVEADDKQAGPPAAGRGTNGTNGRTKRQP